MKKLIIAVPLMVISLLTNCGNDKKKFTVIWKNYNGDVLEVDENVPNGTIPSFDKEKPTKPSDAQYSYTFSTWSPDASKPIVNNTIFTAQFTQSLNSYTVTFDSDGGPDVPSQTVEYGSYAKAPDPVPTKPIDHDYKYVVEYWKDKDGNKFEFDTTPIIANITLKPNWKRVTRIYHSVSFDTDGGEPTIDAVEVEDGFTATPPETIPGKSSTPQYAYAFEEWQLNGTRFDFDRTPITGNITLKAKYTEEIRKYTVTFDSDNGEDSIAISVEYNNLIPAKDIPSNPSKEDKYRSYVFNGWHQVINNEMEEEVFNFIEETITQDITLRAKWEAGETKHYKISGIPSEDGILHFTPVGQPTEELTNVDIVAGKDFECMMRIRNEYDEEYMAPNTVDIFLGDSEVPLKDDKCFDITNSEAHATIKIFGDYVCDNITIKATPVKIDSYYLSVKSYGVKSDSESRVCKQSEDVVIQFSKDEYNHDLPTNKDFYIKIDDEEWGYLSSYTNYCEYNDVNHTLTINKDTVKMNVSIKVRSPYPSYSLLEDLSWKQIEENSNIGWAPYIFHIGEEKKVKVNGLNHKVKIVGFNHDQITGAAKGVKAGITFEFFNVITNKNNAENVVWNDSDQFHEANHNFLNSTLNKFLTKDSNCVFSRLPSDLQNVIKKVNKDITLYKNDEYTVDSYNTKLFPLSIYEITANHPEHAKKEGSQYEYWINHDNKKDRIKKTVNGSSYSYWLRTPYADKLMGMNCLSYDVHDNGEQSYDKITTSETSVAPAFCI